MPNRKFPTPPPFVYHPELFPNLSQNNPEPFNFKLRTKNRNMRRKQPISAHVVNETKGFRMSENMTPKIFAEHQAMYDFKQEVKQTGLKMHEF